MRFPSIHLQPMSLTNSRVCEHKSRLAIGVCLMKDDKSKETLDTKGVFLPHHEIVDTFLCI